MKLNHHSKEWNYTNLNGFSIGKITRTINTKTGKKAYYPKFRGNMLDGFELGFISGLRPIFNLSLLAKANTEVVFIVEGEKCASALTQLGKIATTSPCGSNSAKLADWSPLKKFKHIIIWADNDEPGKKYLTDVIAVLTSLNIRNISTYVYQTDKKGSDVIDWMQSFVPSWDGYKNLSKNQIDLLNKRFTQLNFTTLKNKEETISEFSWEKIISLHHKPSIPWPKNIFPDRFEKLLHEISESTETPYELAASFFIVIIAACVQRKFNVLVKEGYKEILSLWIAVALPSGNRKSAVVNLLKKPVIAWERRKEKELKPIINQANIKTSFIKSQIKTLGKENNCDDLEGKIIELENSYPIIPNYPRVWAEDITPEKLAMLMNEHEGSMSILSDEGGIFDTLAGQYSSKGIANIDIFLKAYTGSSLRVDRGSRPPISIDSPRLSIGLSPQVEPVKGLCNKAELRNRGLIARFHFIFPKSTVGARTGNKEAVSQESLDCLDNSIQKLLDMSFDEVGVVELKLSEGAKSVLNEFSKKIESQIAPFEPLSHIVEWCAKLPGNVVRYSGIIHLLNNFDKAGGIDLTISEGTMKKSCLLGDYILDQTQCASDLMGVNQAKAGAIQISEWIQKEKLPSFKVRDCHHKLKHRFKSRDELDQSLNILIEHHYIMIKKDVKKGATGGRPSDIVCVSPYVQKNF